MNPKVSFDMPFIGTTVAEGLTLLYTANGNYSAILKMENPIVEFAADGELYNEYSELYGHLIKILGNGFILQKTDIIAKKLFSSPHAGNKEYLTKKYFDHFDGRKYSEITTYLTITKENDKGRFFSYNQAEIKDFVNRVFKVSSTLENSHIKPTALDEHGINTLQRRYLSFNFNNDTFAFSNIKASDEALHFGSKDLKVVSLIDIDELNLPAQIKTYSYLHGLGNKFPVDNFSWLFSISEAETLLYNQVIFIPDQIKTKHELESKKKRHTSMPDASNDISVQDIDTMFLDIAKDNELLVYCHYTVLLFTDTERMNKAVNQLDNGLFTMGIIPSKNTYNQMELFRTAVPGNAGELNKYDKFLTSRPAACSFFMKERLPETEEGRMLLYYTDRQGIPIGIDTSETPMNTGRITNRNKFILGPSGTGKSFFTNSYVKQWLQYDADVIIVDTGHSYFGTCKYFGGKYITYEEDNPITMNPFRIEQIENNEEKRKNLVALIGLIWKGSSGSLNPVEDDVITRCVTAYYNDYFGLEDSLYLPIDEMSQSGLEGLLRRIGVNPETIFEEAIGVLHDKKSAIIKQTYRRIAKIAHPDMVAPENKETAEKIFVQAQVALEKNDEPALEKILNFLTSENPFNSFKKEGGETLENPLTLAENTPTQSLALREEYKALLYDKLVALTGKKVKELNFNSFYEFSSEMIAKIIEDKKISFDLITYEFLLSKFYKGGNYEKILNDDYDNTLFNEKFIVFEIDNIKEDKILFPITTLIIMDVFIQKMRLKSERKILIIEEAWKALASPMMAVYILYLYKTVRKFNGEAIVVTQELADIVGNPIVKDSIISNSDTICLLDQNKFRDNFDQIRKLLAITPVEENKLFTVNRLDNKSDRSKFKEVYIRRGSQGEVYGVEVSLEEYLTFSTERSEREVLTIYLDNYGDYQTAINALISDLKDSGLSLPVFVQETLKNNSLKMISHTNLNQYEKEEVTVS